MDLSFYSTLLLGCDFNGCSVASTVSTLVSTLDSSGVSSPCWCGTKTCTVPFLRSDNVEGVIVTWDENSPEDILYSTRQRIRMVLGLVTCLLQQVDLSDTPNEEFFDCIACPSLICGADTFEDHLKFEEKRLSERLLNKLKLIYQQPGITSIMF
jgi:hypothetical protein